MKSKNSLTNLEVEDDDNFADPYNLPDDFWESGVMEIRNGKEHISIRLDNFVLDYFKRPGPGYQGRISDVLRSFVIHQMMKEAEAKAARSLAEQAKA
jgi:uncharacterized protein (DUF4415 family)